MTTKVKIKQVCTEVKDKLVSLKIEDKLISELEWCLGSYSFDGNSVGLIEKADDALSVLVRFKKENPRKVAKKLIVDLEKVVSSN